MFNARQEPAFSGTIGPEFIGHDHPGHVAQALEELAEETLGRHRATAATAEDWFDPFYAAASDQIEAFYEVLIGRRNQNDQQQGDPCCYSLLSYSAANGRAFLFLRWNCPCR
jgi:hypothetical protein